jgi:hypothetical protein
LKVVITYRQWWVISQFVDSYLIPEYPKPDLIKDTNIMQNLILLVIRQLMMQIVYTRSHICKVYLPDEALLIVIDIGKISDTA